MKPFFADYVWLLQKNKERFPIAKVIKKFQNKASDNKNKHMFKIRKWYITRFSYIAADWTNAELCLQNNIYYTKLRRVFQNKKQTDAYTRNMRKL